MGRRSRNKNKKIEEKKIEKTVERKDRALLERALAEVLPSDELAALASDAIGFGLDAASAFDPTGISRLALAGGRAFGLLLPNPTQNPYSGKYKHPAIKRVAASGSPLKVSRSASLIHSVMIPSRTRSYIRRRSGALRSGELGTTGVPFVATGGIGLTQYHESLPLKVEGAAGNWHAIESRQFIGRLPDTAVAGELLYSIPLDLASGPLSLTRIATLAHLYDRVKWNHVAIVFVPTCSAATGGAITLASWTDPTRTLADYDEGEARINAALTMDSNVANTQLWQGAMLMPDEIEQPRFQSTAGFATPQDELRLDAAGRLEVMALSSWTGLGTSPGLIYVEASLIGQNDVIPAGSSPAPNSRLDMGAGYSVSSVAGCYTGGDSVLFGASYALYPALVPCYIGTAKNLNGSFDIASNMIPKDIGSSGGVDDFSHGMGLNSLGWKIMDFATDGLHVTSVTFKVPYGTWAFNCDVGYSIAAAIGNIRSLFLDAAPIDPATITLKRNDFVAYGPGQANRVCQTFVSQRGEDQVRLVRSSGGTSFTATGQQIHLAIFVGRIELPALAEQTFFDNYVKKRLRNDPSFRDEIGPREFDAGESSYEDAACSSTTLSVPSITASGTPRNVLKPKAFNSGLCK